MKKLCLILMLICLAGAGVADNLAIYHFETSQKQQMFQQLTYELRCMVCQNQNLADSNAPLANDLRREIANKINAGQSKQDIIQYMVARYGDFVLYKPPFNAQTVVLWLGPFVLLILGLFLLMRKIKRDNQNVENLSEQDESRLKEIL